MSFELTFRITGSEALLDRMEKYPDVANKAALRAINDTVRKGRIEAKRMMLKKANLPPSYIDETRLTSVLATRQRLEGKIIGRYRATSLARFAAQQMTTSKKTGRGKKNAGVSVQVRNRRKPIPKAFFLNLKNNNRGLAIRLPEGQTPNRRYVAKPLYSTASKSGNAIGNKDVYLLYGPSIHQLLTSNKTGPSIAEELQPELTRYLNAEFERQFGLLNNG